MDEIMQGGYFDESPYQDNSGWIGYERDGELEAENQAKEAAKKRTIIPGYSACYYRRPLEEQIEVIRGFWPQLNPGSRIEELGSRVLLFGSEGVFALPKWESIARIYGDALEKEVFAALYDLHNGNFYSGFRFEVLGQDHLRQNEHTGKAFRKLNAEQDGDILVIQAQLGAHHRDRSPLISRRVYMLNEFGLTAFAAGCMLLTHPSRLTVHSDRWVDCPGDEYRHVYSKEFNHTPCFFFHAGKVFFSTYSNDIDFKNSGPATGLALGSRC